MRARALFIPALCALLLLPAGAATQRIYFTGALGGQYRVQMDLTLEGEGVTGTYYYEAVGMPIALRGKVVKGAVTLEELDSAGKRAATLTGKLVLPAGRLTGAWKSADGTKSFPVLLTAVATYRFRGMENGTTSVSAAYPQFLRATPALKALNKKIQVGVEAAQKEFIESARGAGDPPGTPGWSQDFHYSIGYYADDLLSLLVTDEEYTGGAHGNTGYRSVAYRISGGALKPFGLAEIFKPNAGYLPALSKRLVTELRRQQAGWITDDSVNMFKEGDLDVFTFTPKTLVFVFAPYAVGPYAQGSFFAPVPFKALEDYLNTKGPLARFFTGFGQRT
ncbi:MAG: DUF3298 and DUF4163 domain-containing protein [Armatimonadota bacterium]